MYSATEVTYLTVAEMADLLRVSRRHIYNLVARGMPHLLVGKAIRFNFGEVLRWLMRHSSSAAGCQGHPICFCESDEGEDR